MNILCFFNFHRWVGCSDLISDYELRACTCCGERQIRSGSVEGWHEY